MKSILYVGATLMIGASIYGFVDYKQTKKQKEFKEMYTEKKEDVPVITTDEKMEEPVVEKETTKQLVSTTEKKPVQFTKKIKPKKKKKINTELFSRAALSDEFEKKAKKRAEKESIKKIELKEE